MFIYPISEYKFNTRFQQYIERAANANTISLAKGNLDIAILYLENNNLTNGVVSVILHQPCNDIGYYYSNLKSAQKELNNTSYLATQLETSNILLKLHETLLGNIQGEMPGPNGMARYPYNRIIFLMFIGGIFLYLIARFLKALEE